MRWIDDVFNSTSGAYAIRIRHEDGATIIYMPSSPEPLILYEGIGVDIRVEARGNYSVPIHVYVDEAEPR